MDIKTKFKSLVDFIPFASSLTFLTCLRTVLPPVYALIERRYSNNLVKTDGAFKTIVPNQFLHYSTSNFKFLKSTWDSMLLTCSTKAKVGTSIKNQDLSIVNRHTLIAHPLTDLLTNKNKYYILNFGSSS